MGEYAEVYFRNEVQEQFGFDPGPEPVRPTKPKFTCPICRKKVKTEMAIKDHIRDSHKGDKP